MPKLWEDTIEAHRRQVRDAVLATTAGLVAEHGVLSVTMSQIAETTGIGRATLYKYFSSVEEILLDWHQREVATHLEELTRISNEATGAANRLRAVLERYARIGRERAQHGQHAAHRRQLHAFVHRDDQLAPAEQRLHQLMRDVLSDAAAAGVVRDDVAPDELATYCIRALDAAGSLPSNAAVQRLVHVVEAGLQPAD